MKNRDTATMIRLKLNERLRDSGLLEYGCLSESCFNQVFASWSIDVTCNKCGQRMQTRYELDQQ